MLTESQIAELKELLKNARSSGGQSVVMFISDVTELIEAAEEVAKYRTIIKHLTGELEAERDQLRAEVERLKRGA